MMAKTRGPKRSRCSNSFYRAGWLVFGGGNVVLSLLQAEVVPPAA